jgi:hypothetical protein
MMPQPVFSIVKVLYSLLAVASTYLLTLVMGPSVVNKSALGARGGYCDIIGTAPGSCATSGNMDCHGTVIACVQGGTMDAGAQGSEQCQAHDPSCISGYACTPIACGEG